MLQIYILNETQRKRIQHFDGPIEFGRGPRRDVPRFQIQDKFVSSDQLRVEEMAPGRLAIENCGAVNAVFADGSKIGCGAHVEADLPVRLCVGNTLIEIQRGNGGAGGGPLETVAQPLQFVDSRGAESLLQLGDSPDAETIAHWFETVVTVQRSCASTSEFYEETARAVVELVGLDCGLVLLRDGETWRPAAEYHAGARHARTAPSQPDDEPCDEVPREFSRTILTYVVKRRRTFFQTTGSSFNLTESLAHVAAVVASPIFDSAGEVVGVVYGARFHAKGSSGVQIRPLEAQVVQVLAAAVGAGLARLESEAEAARQRAQMEQLQVKLDVARDIQAAFFPRQMPAVDGYDLAGFSEAADATGGDYYDLMRLADGQLGVVVADVCGHGLGASLLMASMRSVLRGLARLKRDPARLLTDLNESIFDDLSPRHRFITLLYGVLDPRAHRFRFANAGHGPLALYLPADGEAFRMLAEDEARHCPLGVIREAYSPCAPVAMSPGDLLVLGSDGIVETHRDGERFGMDRLCRLIVQHRSRPAAEMVHEIVAASKAFHELDSPDDDLTLVVVRRL
jgi:serine phosphatase RsbU (regulator of sigma subunit)